MVRTRPVGGGVGGATKNEVYCVFGLGRTWWERNPAARAIRVAGARARVGGVSRVGDFGLGHGLAVGLAVGFGLGTNLGEKGENSKN